MTRSGDPSSEPYHYVGGELDLFAKATNWKRYFSSKIARFVRGDVLEVGAGIGETTRHLCDGRQRSWVCLEPDPDLAERLESSLELDPLIPRPTVEVGTLATIDADRRFDAILYIDVLEHIEDDHAELERANAHLNHGGAIVVLSPAFSMAFSELDRAFGHWRRYTRTSLAAVFPRAMRKRWLTYLDSVGFMASVANRVFLRQSMPSSRQIAVWDRGMIPVSRVVDPVLGHFVGRSVVGVYEHE
jgi:SAM-dependent methyltransferase